MLEISSKFISASNETIEKKGGERGFQGDKAANPQSL